MNGRNSISFISFVLLAFLAVPSWAGQLVIIASSSPDHPAGGMIEDGANVTLAAGTELSLVSESGQVIMLKGPHSGAVAAAAGGGDKTLTAALAKLVAPQGAGASKLGVMRGGAKAEPPDVWHIDVGRSGTHCFRTGTVPALWRANTKKSGSLSLKELPKGGKTKVNWPKGTADLQWPSEVSVRDGVSVMVRLKGQRTAARVKLKQMPELSTDAHRVVWMAENGCVGQARKLLATLR